METQTETEIQQTKSSKYNEKVKQNIYKWRENNLDKYNETNRRGSKTYYERNKEKLKAKQKQRYNANKLKKQVEKQVENQIENNKAEKLVEAV